MTRFCLDTWPVMRWLLDEPGIADRVAEIIDDGAVMSWINLGEVFPVTRRDHGEERARYVVDTMRTRVTLDLPTSERVLEAATIKADYPMSYADAFAVATAQARGAVLVTGVPEILDAGGPWTVEDLR